MPNTHRTRRFDQLDIPLGFLKGTSPEEFDALLDIVAPHAKLISDSTLAVSGIDANSQQAADALCDIVTKSVLMTLYQLSDKDSIYHNEQKTKISALMAATSFFTIMTTESPDDETMGRFRMQYRPILRQLAHICGEAALGMSPDVPLKYNDLIETIREHKSLSQERFDNFIASIAIMAGIDEDERKEMNPYDLAERCRQSINESLKKIDEIEEQMAAIKDAKDKMSHQLDDANDALLKSEKENTALKQQNHELQQQIHNINHEQDAKQAELDEIRRDLEHRQTALDTAEAMKSTPDNAITSADQLLRSSKLITVNTAADAIALIKQIYGNQIAFSDKADDDIKTFQGNPTEMFNALRAILNEYLPPAQNGRPLEPRTFKELTGFELSANESKMTRKNETYMAMRTAKIDGKQLTSSLHLKGTSNDNVRALRIYFTYQKEEERIAIIRCGGHLDTIGSKKRGY